MPKRDKDDQMAWPFEGVFYYQLMIFGVPAECSSLGNEKLGVLQTLFMLSFLAFCFFLGHRSHDRSTSILYI